MSASLLIGTAGWSIPTNDGPAFPTAGTHLERYATRMGAVEINSSFYHPHRHTTYVRWAASVPDGFHFAVKLPKAMSHTRRLQDCGALLAPFVAAVEGLGGKLAVLLLQLPPSLPFSPMVFADFMAALRDHTDVSVACEPRHPGWFTPGAEACLTAAGVARVAADPPPVPGADRPGGSRTLAYWRLHGSPRIYHSDSGPDTLAALQDRLAEGRAAGTPTWCIFDNTAASHALGNALSLARGGA